VIQDVQASCGCTTPEWSKEPILPGKSGFINVSYNPEQRPGVFDKSITVSANVPKTIRVLTISGEVIPKVLSNEDLFPVDFGKLRLVTGELSFVKIKDNEIKTDTLHFYNPGTSPVTIKFKIIPPYIRIKTVPEVIAPKAKGHFLITFDANQKPSFGYVTNRIYLAFNGDDKFDNALKVSAIVEEDFSKFTPADLANAPRIDYSLRSFDFGEITEGKLVDCVFKLTNKGKKDLIIRSVSPSCTCTVAQPSSNVIKSGEKADLRVTFNSRGMVGRQNKTITVISNDPANSTTLIRLTGSVKK